MLDPKSIGNAGVPAGAELLAFVNAAHGDSNLMTARGVLRDAVGEAGLVEAAATIAAFNGLVRVADGTGIQLDAGVLADSADFRQTAGINDFGGAVSSATVDPGEAPDRSSVTGLFA